MKIIIYIEHIKIPDIEHTITNGGSFNFFILIKQYDTIPTKTIARTVGILQEAYRLKRL